MQGNNIIDFAKNFRDFRNPKLKFHVSARALTSKSRLIDYLKIYYNYLDLQQIDSVFGNCVYPSKLYGGRSYKKQKSLSESHLKELRQIFSGRGLSGKFEFFGATSSG